MTAASHFTFGIVLPDDSLGVLFDPESAREQRDSVGYRPRGEPKSGTWTPGLPIENEPPNALRSVPEALRRF
jgi:hypothetical protein